MHPTSRRQFLHAGLGSLAAAAMPAATARKSGSASVQIVNPRQRVPLSFVIDDSTCLVNMGHFCTPQFAAAFPDRTEYRRPWKTWPREIPDSFVRTFGEWCAEHGVKGKYSIVPYPACVGWLDRELPGWSRKELKDSLKLVRELMVPNWDIHPEMITHTRVIDLKTGRPMANPGPATIENSYPQKPVSVDELAAYIAYALRILRNCDLPCEGITTPGGFGNRVKPELSKAVQQAVTDVFQTEIPHYFKYVVSGEDSPQPKCEHVSVNGTDIRLTVNVPAGTGDWFGGWQGVETPRGHLYCNDDASSGRMVELIQRGGPAVMLCHWPGLYCNGRLTGFHHFQKVVTALARRFGNETIWMKLSEIARYFAAKELSKVGESDGVVTLDIPFQVPDFTLQVERQPAEIPSVLDSEHKTTRLASVPMLADLRSGTYFTDGRTTLVCIDAAKGRSLLKI